MLALLGTQSLELDFDSRNNRSIHSFASNQPAFKIMAPKKGKQPAVQENVSLGPQVAEGRDELRMTVHKSY